MNYDGLITLIRKSGSYTYIGKAATDSATSDAVWQINRIYENGDDYDVKYASGGIQLDKVFDNRATYTYS